MNKTTGRRRFGQAGRVIGAALAVLVAAFLLAPGDAGAQLLDYQRLLGIGAAPAESAPVPDPAATPDATPAAAIETLPQSRPVFDPSAVPTGADYGQLTRQPPPPGTTPMLAGAQQMVAGFQYRLATIVAQLPGALDEIGTTLAVASPTGRPLHFLGIAAFACLLLVIGRAVADLYAAFVARPVFVRMQQGPAVGYGDKLPVLAYRVLLTIIGVAITLVVATLVGLFFKPGDDATLATVMIVFAAYAAIQVIDNIWRMTIAPFLEKFRLPPMPSRDARRLYRWLSVASGFGVLSTAFCYWVEALGLPREVYVLVTVILTFVTVLLLIVGLSVNRAAISGVILRGRPRSEASWISVAAAALWAPFAIVYLIATWADLGFRLVMGADTGPARLIVPYFTILGGLIVYAVIVFAIDRLFRFQRRMRAINAAAEARRRAEEEAERERNLMSEVARFRHGDSGDIDGDGEEEASAPRPAPAPAPRPVPGPAADGDADALVLAAEMPPMRPGQMQTLEDLARRVASLFALGAGAYALIWFWGGREIFEENLWLGLIEDVIDVAFIGYIAYHAVRITLDQKIREEGADQITISADEGGGAGASRVATLLPLFRNFVLIVIAVSIAVILAMELGVNVAPLFAGAGIVGLAIGFGAQTLVRDILSGAFFLLDDAFRKGEYIDVGDVKGTVEKISLRSFQLRHHLGMLHTIPFGEITHLTNFSRDWVIMKLPLRLTYDTDVERVRKLVKKLGEQLMQDPEIGERFLQPLKSQGVIMMEDSAMIIRVKFMTRPGDQWVVRKRVFQEIRALFEREGIKFAHREVTVRIPDLPEDRPLSPEERRAIGAASRSVLDVIEGEGRLQPRAAGLMDDR